jgi:serine/threonine-protein kinase
MIGTTLLDRYRIDAELGRGGVGVVYRARDLFLERDVAVKILEKSGGTGLDTEARLRLLHEARAAAQLNHPNIVTVFDAGQSGELHFIIMELVEGRSLQEQRPELLAEALSIGQQVCAALQHAHTHGIIHRDLKPGNVILAADGTAKLTDFGLARSIASHITIEGKIVGTVFYLPPEQAMGKEVDARTDLYALGVMLYELVTGRLPFTADEPLAVISQHLYAPAAAWLKPRSANDQTGYKPYQAVDSPGVGLQPNSWVSAPSFNPSGASAELEERGVERRTRSWDREVQKRHPRLLRRSLRCSLSGRM